MIEIYSDGMFRLMKMEDESGYIFAVRDRSCHDCEKYLTYFLTKDELAELIKKIIQIS